MKRWRQIIIFILITIIVVSFTIFCYKTINSSKALATLSSSKPDLEVQKLQFEVSNMQKEHNFYMFKFWLSNLSPVAAFITIIWTIFAGYKAFSRQIEQKKDETVTHLLENISSEIPSVRLAGARGLNNYADDALYEIISAIAYEKEDFVKNQLENILFNINKKSINKILMLNNSMIMYRIVLLGKLKKLNLDEKLISAILNCETDILHSFIRESPFKITYEHSKKIENIKIGKLHTLTKYSIPVDSEENIKNSLLKNAQISVCFSEVTSKVISYMLNKGTQLRLPNDGIDLSGTNLYKANLKSTKAINVFLINCILRHINLKNSHFSYSYFNDSNLYGAYINNSVFKNVSFKKVNLTECSATKIYIENSAIDFAFFDRANLYKSTLNSIKGKSAQFINAKLNKSYFHKCYLSKCTFNNSELINAKLEDSDFLSCEFIKTDFSNTTIKNVKFNGSNLNGAKFNNTKLYNVDFRGADLHDTDFEGASIEKVKFSHNSGVQLIEVAVTSSSNSITST